MSVAARRLDPIAYYRTMLPFTRQGVGCSRQQVEERTILEQHEASLPQEALQAAGRPLLQDRLGDLRCDMLFLSYAELRTQNPASQTATGWDMSKLFARRSGMQKHLDGEC